MFSRSSDGGKRHGFICSTYVRNGAGACRRNYIDEADLKALIMPKIRELLSSCIEEGAISESVFAPIFGPVQSADPKKRLEALNAECEELRRREYLAYEDRLKGVVSEELFQRMSAFISQRRDQLEARIQRLQNRVLQRNPLSVDHLTEQQIEQALACGIARIKVKDGEVSVNYVKQLKCKTVL